MKTVGDNWKHSGTGHLLACVTSSVCGGPNVGVIRLVGSLHSRVALCPPGDPLAGVSVGLSKDLPFPLRPSAHST